IVAESAGLSDLVCTQECEQPADRRVRKRQRARAGVERGWLGKVPIALKIENCVEHADRSVEDLARARIMNMRADCVLDGRRKPANDRVTHILRRPIRIVRGWIHWDDGVLESSSLERRLPIENRLSHPRLP